MKDIYKIISLVVLLQGCSARPFRWDAPPWDFEAYEKSGASSDDIKIHMKACGFVDIYRRPPEATLDGVARRERCMFANGFSYKSGYEGICSQKGGVPVAACAE